MRRGPRRAGTVALLACLGCGPRGARAPEPAPTAAAPAARNVVLLLLDTLRADHLSAYGYGRPTSPHLDAFGRQHVRFASVRSQATCTYPSVNSLLTSRSAYLFLGQPRRHLGIPPGIPTLAERLRARGLRTAAVSASSIVRRTRSEHNDFGEFDRGFDAFDESCLHQRADCVNRRARRFLNHTAEPFFLYLHYVDPHARYEPPAEFRARFAGDVDGPRWVREGNPRPLYESLAGTGPHVTPTAADLRHLVDLYDGEVASLDARVGELLADLAARGLLERTVVVIAADHGEEFLEHGRVWHCDNLYETTLRVPLFLHLPGVGPHPAVETQVDNLDVVPTILDALGAPLPPELEGRSLLPLLDGETPGAPRPSFALQNEYRSASDGRFKLVTDAKADTARLFDLRSDPGETRDVATAERAAFHTLRGELAAWLRRVEGDAGTDTRRRRALGDETRKLLESLGYLR